MRLVQETTLKDTNRSAKLEKSQARTDETGALVLRLDEVRPVRQQPAAAPIVPKPFPRKTTVIYRSARVSDMVAKAKGGLSGTSISFFLMVIVPTIIGALYFAFVASPQYMSEFRFSVRPTDGAYISSSSSSVAADTALAMSNSYIVADYAISRDAVEALEKSVGLREIYSMDSIDGWSRLSEDVSLERLVDYWRKRVSTSYDIMTGINTIEVTAFSPQDALKISTALQALCEKLVNDISEKARQSQMAFAKNELDRAEARLKEVRQRETELRSGQKSIDVRKDAEGKMLLNNQLRGDLSTLKAQYSALSSYMDPTSPRLTVLKNQIAAAQEQIELLQSQVTDVDASKPGALDDAQRVTKYDQLQTDVEITTKLYESSLTNYENARMRASNNQTYLATYVQPGLPQIASYPRTFIDTLLVFLSAFGAWVVLTLIYYSIRDHA
jgi:capsular polysaccharide transport system permease protein